MISVIITAGGAGKRMLTDVPKQFLPLNGKPVIVHSINLFLGLAEVKEIIVVIGSDQVNELNKILAKENLDCCVNVVEGGERRQDSVRNGMAAVSSEIEYVLIHDAVRPNLSKECINKLIEQGQKEKAAILGVKVKPTLKIVDDNDFVKQTLDRNLIWEVQTPQMFEKKVLEECYNKDKDFYKNKYTDEASLVEKFGYKVKMVEGEYGNIKITTKEDLKILELLM